MWTVARQLRHARSQVVLGNALVREIIFREPRSVAPVHWVSEDEGMK
jgi:hypothetical protein